MEIEEMNTDTEVTEDEVEPEQDSNNNAGIGFLILGGTLALAGVAAWRKLIVPVWTKHKAKKNALQLAETGETKTEIEDSKAKSSK